MDANDPWKLVLENISFVRAQANRWCLSRPWYDPEDVFSSMLAQAKALAEVYDSEMSRFTTFLGHYLWRRMIDEERRTVGRTNDGEGKTYKSNLARRRDMMRPTFLESFKGPDGQPIDVGNLGMVAEEESGYAGVDNTIFIREMFEEMERILTPDDVEFVKLRAMGATLMEIADHFGFTESRASQVLVHRIRPRLQAAGFDFHLAS